MEDLRFNLFWGFYSKQSTDIALEELYKLIITSADLRHITERHRGHLVNTDESSIFALLYFTCC